MSIVDVTQVSQIPPGTMKSFIVGDKQILITNHDGQFYAISNICTHAGGDLSKGKLEGKIVTCPRHGSRFDVATGICVLGPKIAFFRFKTRNEPTYPVIIEGSSIKVDV